MKRLFFSLLMICAFGLNANASDTDERNLKVYPNPIERNTLVTVEMPKYEHGEVTVHLYNTVGKLVSTIKSADEKVEFFAPEVSGIYLIRIVEKQKVVAVGKIVVKE